MRKRVMSQALLVDFHLSVYLLVLYRICADLCIFLSKRIAIKCIFSHYVCRCCRCCFFFCALSSIRILDAVYAYSLYRRGFLCLSVDFLFHTLVGINRLREDKKKTRQNPPHHYAHYKRKVTIFTHN